MYFTLLSPLSMKNGVLYPITQTLKERSNSLLLRDAVVTFANHGCRILASVLVGYIITTIGRYELLERRDSVLLAVSDNCETNLN